MSKEHKYSYTNKSGEKIYVNTSHLDTAVKIKLELQKASPSLRCNWNQHKKLMKKSGFSNSENSEAYRCLVKSYQSKVNKLPKNTEHYDILSQNKIEQIKSLTGELAYRKREIQNYLREFNKVKREINDNVIVTEAIQEAYLHSLVNEDWSKPSLPPIYKNLDKSPPIDMLVVLSDWHIGGHVSIKTNQFNYEIAKDRVSQYIERILSYKKIYNARNVYVVGIGDMIEHVYMRHNQAYDAEFSLSEQIVKTAKLISSMLQTLCNEFEKVYYTGVAGNHDRMSGGKNDSLSDDYAIPAINEIINLTLNATRSNYRFMKSDLFMFSLAVQQTNIKFEHGHFGKKVTGSKIQSAILEDNILYDAHVSGHFHTSSIIEVGQGRIEAISGSLKGSDDFSNMIKKSSKPSQLIGLIQDKNIDFIPIFLD